MKNLSNMFNLPIKAKQLCLPVFISLLAILLWLLEPASHEIFPYDRTAIINGQWWRVISGHFLHTNIMHLVLNITGLILLWALHGHYYNYQTFGIIILLCLGTSLGIFIFANELLWYVGLSGILHGLFIFGAYWDISKNMKTGWLLFIIVWLKVLHEQIVGPSDDIQKLIEANVAIDAHLFGTISGTIIVLALYLRKSKTYRIK
ncbi:rhombosortase [Paraglaciecola aquimarina]|uniref:Rhombosortase n=1 Tax=Paraglaciecola algarum TaxID=3050085 RepID=A0ABS9D7V4_9ALTE|nr:rhombosortase [Paraglaciecola sp. G1-23]MCF2949010.1 rhombosortase [Paraglaciecola sp. G1-23]